jgi:hypothetical protein
MPMGKSQEKTSIVDMREGVLCQVFFSGSFLPSLSKPIYSSIGATNVKKIRGISRLTRVPAGKPVEVPAGNRFSAILLDHERESPHIGLDVTFLGVGVWYFMANLFKKTVISKESLRLEDR